MSENRLIIGLDGGATKISGWEILYDQKQKTFCLGSLHSEKKYEEIPGFIKDFKPVELQEQLKDNKHGQILQTDDEKQQETVYVEACAQVIESIVSENPDLPVLIGLGMPGIKTEDKRGIAIVANGPRMIQYSDLLEKRLFAARINLACPLKHIGSDADYCGIGENYANDGLFKDYLNSYYLGGGTGAADAMKLDGELYPFDKIKDWMAKSWEMKSSSGLSMERYASAGGIQSIYSSNSGIPVSELNSSRIYPLQIADLAQKGEKTALNTLAEVSDNLAILFFERILTLYSGWQGHFDFINPNKPALSKDHPFKGNLFDSIIVGQRLGQLFQSTNGKTFVKEPTISKFLEFVSKEVSFPEKVKQHYMNTDQLFHVSKLREAPALGAGIDAYLSN